MEPSKKHLAANVADKPPRAGLKKWLGLTVLALPCLLMSMDISVLYLALPHIAADLAPSNAQMLWIVDIYGFMLAGFLIIMGKLADRIGRRRLLMLGAAAFGMASLLVAYAASAEMLIATRAMLGIAGATLMPSTLSLIRNLFQDAKERSTAIGIWMMCLVIGSVIGPIVGGLMLEVFWWGSVFLLGVPIMFLLLASAPALLPEYRDPAAGKLDMGSAVLSLATMLSIVYGVKKITASGIQADAALTLAAGIGLGWLFMRRQKHADDPLLDVTLFRHTSIRSALIIMLIGLITLSGLNLYIAQYLQLVLEMSPLIAGLWLMPMVGGVIAGSIVAPLAARRFASATVIAGGLVIACSGYLALAQLAPSSSLALLAAGSILFAFGISPLTVLGTDLIVGAAPPEKAGSASAVSETSAELGTALGIAVLGSIANYVYRLQISDGALSNMPAEAIKDASDSLAGAAAAAQDLPEELRAALLDQARAAFAGGLSTIAYVSAGLVFLLAVFAALSLRGVRTGGAGHETGANHRPLGS